MEFRSFKTQLVVYGGGLILFIAILLLFLFSYRINIFLNEDLISCGTHSVLDLSRASELGVSAEDPVLARPFIDAFFKREEVVLVALYNYRGRLLFSKKELNVRLEENINRQIKENLEKERGVLKIKNETEDGVSVYEFYAPIVKTDPFFTLDSDRENEIIGFSKLTFSLSRIEEQSKQMILYGFFVIALIILIGSFLIFLLARTLTEPLLELKRGVDIIGEGDLDYRIHVKTKNEIGELSQSFNKMTEKLQRSYIALKESKSALEIKVKARTKELEGLAQSLETQVKERTKELQKRVNELESFQKLTVGREVKMVELKKEAERLKKELEKK